MENLEINEKEKQKTGQKLSHRRVLTVFSAVLLFFSFAFPQFVLAQTFSCDAGSTVDADKDGVPAPGGPLYSQLSPCPDNYPDCNDTDPWSHRYGSKDIASVKVAYAPAYVTKMQTEKKFTPDSKKFNPLLGNLLVTVTFKAKKCGVTASSIFMPMKAYYTTKDSSGNEISIGLQLLADTGSITASDNLVRVSDLVYSGSIPGINMSTSDVEPYIASVAAGRPVQLKFLGSDVGVNKDSPYYYTFPQAQMTNCAQVYGGGKHKVVYMRTNSAGLNMNYFRALSDQVVFYGFNAIEPFKTYKTQFSHFLDLKSHPIVAAEAINAIKDNKDSSFVRTASSCGQFSSLYFLFDKIPFDVGPFVARFYNRVVFLDTNYLNEESHAVETGPIAIHEAAHAFAGLMDEYPYFLRNAGVWRTYLYKKADSGSNCSSIPSINYSYLSRMYGRLDAKICSLDTLFKPSMNSLMMGSKRNGENRFNVISCSYILKFIKKDAIAKTYFPECAAMAARDGGIIPVGQ